MEKRVTKQKPRRPARIRKAATADVLAGSNQQVKIPNKWSHHYERLLELREDLMRERHLLKKNASEESPQFSLHIADAGTDSYDRDLALGMLSNEQDALYEIEQALDRIRSGTYGICELTKRPISAERLDAIPWTRFSVAAEKQLEKEGHGETRKARLGDRESVGGPDTSAGDEDR